MKLALETMLTLQLESLLQRFAIGGAIAASLFLAAIALQLGRAKDYQRVDALVATDAFQCSVLKALVESHNLQDRWEIYVRRMA